MTIPAPVNSIISALPPEMNLSAVSSTVKFNVAARRHPVYFANEKQWQFFQLSYDGGKNYVTAPGNLKKHPFEKPLFYDQRLERAYFYNYCAPIVDGIVNHLFKGGVMRKGAESLQDFYANVNGEEDDIGSFMRAAATGACTYGKINVLIDMPKMAPEEQQAVEDGRATRVLDRGKTPRLYLYSPLQLLDWSKSEDGWNWVLLTHIERTADDPNISATQKPIYQLWNRQAWTKYNIEGAILDKGEHGLGIVPFVQMSNIGVDRNSCGKSTIKDIALINNAIFNWCSLLDEILYRQTFSQLVAEGTANEYDATIISTAGAFTYPLGRRPPAFISPDASQAELLMKQIEASVKELYRIANIKIGDDKNRNYKTVIENEYDFESFNSVLKNMARACEKFETDIHRVLAAWLKNDTLRDVEIQYPAEFDITSLSQDVEEAEKISGLGMGKPFMEMYKRSIVKKRFPDLDEEALNKISAGFVEPVVEKNPSRSSDARNSSDVMQ